MVAVKYSMVDARYGGRKVSTVAVKYMVDARYGGRKVEYGSRKVQYGRCTVFFFFIKHLYPGYPTRLEAVTNVGSCTTYFVTQTIGL